MNVRMMVMLGAVVSIPAITPISAVADDGLAYKLASIDTGLPVPKRGKEVKRAEQAIAGAMSVCDVPSALLISDQVVTLSNLLNKDDIYAKPVDILEGLGAILSGRKKQDCLSFMAQYANIRKSVDYTHSQAVASMRVLVNSVSTR